MLQLRRANVASVSQVLTIILVASAVAEPASASKRAPAPIVYNEPAPVAGSTPVRPASREPARTSQASTTTQAASDRATRRIEFRYPDQPDIYYGAGGARAADETAPMAFASSQAAITPREASAYAAAQVPQVLPEPIVRDPALTPNAFDARAAARQVSVSRPAAIVDTAALEAIAIQPAPRPRDAQEGQVFEQTGQGVVYGPEFAGLPTANGENLDQEGMTGAHPSLPVPSLVRVSNLDNGKEVVLRINDRGPFEDGAVLQVTQRAADILGFGGAGRGNIHIRYLGPAPVVAAAAPVAPAAQPEIAFARTPAPPEKRAAFQAYLGQDADELLGGSTSAKASPPSRPQPTRQPAASGVEGAAVYVQLASFSEFGNADALVRRIDSRLQPEIVSARVNGADFFRVRVGPLANRETAAGLRDQLAFEGIADGRVVSVD